MGAGAQKHVYVPLLRQRSLHYIGDGVVDRTHSEAESQGSRADGLSDGRGGILCDVLPLCVRLADQHPMAGLHEVGLQDLRGPMVQSLLLIVYQ